MDTVQYQLKSKPNTTVKVSTEDAKKGLPPKVRVMFDKKREDIRRLILDNHQSSTKS